MYPDARWEPCIYHRAAGAIRFIDEYIADLKRRVLLIAGGGFDPRATFTASLLSRTAGTRVKGIFIREERPEPSLQLLGRANKNVEMLMGVLPQHQLWPIKVL